MNNLSIAKVLQTSTFILAKIRFKANDITTRNTLKSMNVFFNRSLELWEYEDFLEVFRQNNPFGDFDTFKQSAEISSRNISPTNNLQEIAKYSVLISKVCESGCNLYDSMKFEQLSDLIDLLHGLPEALLLKEIWNPKVFWKIYFNPYRKRWDRKFMKVEQKSIMKYKKKYIRINRNIM